jgi:alkylation response protein AidB-like acyl-CoA dehydrogenase
MGHIGEGLLGNTVLALGTDDQKARFLKGIQQGTEFWCQGYSEPSAGSDLANVRTKAVQDADGNWRITGQKVWTSWAMESDWIFVIARSEEGSQGNKGLSFFLMPLKQAGVEIRPIKQITGGAEFNEVFFDNALAKKEDIVGSLGDGWKVAMALLGFERGISTLGQQMQFVRELQWVVDAAKANGQIDDIRIQTRLAQAWAGLRVMRTSAVRMLGDTSGSLSREALAYKYYWSNWHRDLGELAMAVQGANANVRDGDDGSVQTRLQHMALFSRSDTIYAGTNEIQLNIMSERGLEMPREPRGR